MSINLKLRSKARYGWVRDLPDHRDLSYSVHRLAQKPRCLYLLVLT